MRIFAHSKRRSQPRKRRFTFEQLEIRRLFAGEIRFTNLSGGLWSTASNWDQNRVPLADDIAIIDLPGNLTVTVDSATAVAQSIVNLEKLAITGSLNVPSTISGPGTIELRGGSLSNATVAADTTIVGTSLGGTLTSVTVNGNFDLSREANTNVRILSGLVLNGTATLGSDVTATYGRMYFGNSGVAAGALTGTANIVMGGSTGNFIQNSSGLAGAAGTLTIGSTVTIRGNTGSIYNDWATGRIVNQGTINVNVAGGNLTLGGNGTSAFANTGTINLSNGTLNLAGSLTLTGLGTINRTGGVLNLTGSLDLEGAGWNLNAATGSWNLVGGTVKNGTINESNGSLLVMTSSGGVLDGITVNGNLDLSREANTNVRILGGLVLNGTATLGSDVTATYGRMYFGNSGLTSGALTGTANIVMGGSTGNFIQNSSGLAGVAGTLTIGPTVTIRGNTGSIYNDWATGRIVNQGTINVNVAGGNLTLGGNGTSAFANTGTINLSNGTLNLAGSLTLTGLGTINRTGGVLNLTGSLDLEGANWNLNAATGSWNLVGGTVKNGTINESNGALLVMTSSGGVLDGITVNGNLDLSREANTNVRILGGLVLNGTATLGSDVTATYGRMYFGNSGLTSGALTGTANIVMGGSIGNFIQNASGLAGVAGTLTIGPTVTIRGNTGSIYNDWATGRIVNQGTINVNVAGGNLTLGGNGTSAFANTGTINLSNGTLNLAGSLTLTGLGTINRTGGVLNLTGSLDLEGANWNLNAATGSWNLVGGTVKNGTINESNGSLLVMTSSGGVLDGITVNGNLDLSREANTNVRILGGLVLNGTATLGSDVTATYGRMYFGNSGLTSGALTGTANIVMGGSTGNFIQNSSGLAGVAGTLTIGSTVTIRGNTGSIYNDWATGRIVNQGTINVNVAGGNLTLGGNGTSAFANTGTINLSNGTLNLAGSLTLTGLGTINRTGGVLNLTGSLDLESANWNLNAATGSWNLVGGTVKNGTINESNGALLVMTSSGGVLDGITVNGNLDLSREANTNVRILGGLVLNGTATLGSDVTATYGRMYFGNSGLTSGALTGTANIVMGGSTGNFIQNSSGLAGVAGTLTFGPTVTIRGNTGSIYNDWATGRIVNQGTINVNVAGGNLTLGGNGTSAFANTGTINLSNGTLNLAGSLTLTGLGTINRTGGVLNLTGSLDLEGANWNLNAATGSWNLVGGTVKNGTINESNGSLLVMTSSGGVLDGITVNGNLDLSREANTNVRILGGLVLNGTATLGSDVTATYGRMYFGNSGLTSGALTGTANIVMGGSTGNFIQNSSGLAGVAGTLTIGSTVSIRGNTGSIYNDWATGRIVNQGTINANVAGGNFTLGGNGTSTFTNDGTINVSNGGNLNVPTSLTLNSTATLSVSVGSTMTVGGSLISATTDPTKFNTQGTVAISGGNASSPRILEVMGEDVSTSLAGFLPSNFSMGSLNLASSTYVKLQHVFDNSPGTGPEALYVNSIIIPAGSTMDLSTLHVYTRALQQGGTVINGTITVIPDSGPLAIGTPTPGSIAIPGQLDEWTFTGRANHVTYVTVNPGAAGANPPFSPQLNWVRVQLLDSNNNILASASSTIAGAVVNLPAVALPADGVYRIQVNAPVVSLSSTGNYVITVWEDLFSVSSFTLTNSTISVRFPRQIDTAKLNLVDSNNVNGATDLTLVGSGVGTVPGSILIDGDRMGFTFIKSGGPFAADNYTFRLRSASNAITDLSGALLDGDVDSVLGGDYVNRFSVAARPASTVVLSAPDFERGAGQAVNLPANTTNGLPITISTGVNVTGASFNLNYNPTLLTITGGTTSIAGATLTVDTATAGVARVTVTSAAQFSATAGALTLVNLLATVPATAPIGTKAVLRLSNVSLTAADAGTLTSATDDVLQISAYKGDVNNSNSITTGDVTGLLRSISGALSTTGFPSFKLADPMLIGDMNDSSTLTTGDATGLLRFISGAAGGFPAIPALPTGLTPTFGADPEIFIPKNLTVTAGNSVTVPIMVNVTEASGVSIAGIDVTFTYDSSRYSIGAISLGSALAGFAFSSSTNTATPGVARLVYSTGMGPTFSHGFVGTLLNVTLTAKSNAAPGTSPINLTAAGASDNDTNDLTIAPAITSGVDASDGIITIPGAANKTQVVKAPNNAIAVPFGTGSNVVAQSFERTQIAGGASVLSPSSSVGNGNTQPSEQAKDEFFRTLGDAVVSTSDTGAFRPALSNHDAAVPFDFDGFVLNSGLDGSNFLGNFGKRRR